MGQMDTLTVFNNVNRDYYSLKKWVSTIQDSSAKSSVEIYKHGLSYPEALRAVYTKIGLSFYYVRGEIMRRCEVTRATAESWLEDQPDSRNRVEAKLRVVETAIVLNLSLKDVNKLLTHYLQLPELDPKKAEDALCIYLIEKQIVLPYGSEKWKISNKVNYGNLNESEIIELKKWEPSVKAIDINGDWAKDAAEVAKSQVGYKENQGFTCYGAWFAGSSNYKYADWSAIFAAWCLNLVGVNDAVFTPIYTKFCSSNSFSVKDWAKGLKASGLFLDLDSKYAPKIGDLVFLDLDKNGIEDHIGIITNVSSEVSTKGDTEIKEEANMNVDAVVGDVKAGDEHVVKSIRFDVSGSTIVGYTTTPYPKTLIDAYNQLRHINPKRISLSGNEVNSTNNQECFSTLNFQKIVSKEVPSYMELNDFLTKNDLYLRDKADKLLAEFDNWLEGGRFRTFLRNQGQCDYARLDDQLQVLKAKRAMISRERTILMCIKLRMPVGKINECLESAGFMGLYPKAPLEGALIVILNGLLASSSCMMNDNSSKRLFLFGTSAADGEVSRCIYNMRSKFGLFHDISVTAANWAKEKKPDLPIFRDEQFKNDDGFSPDSWLSIEKFITSVTNGEADAALQYMPDAYQLMCWLADPRNQDGNKTYIRKMIDICMGWYIEKRQKQGFSLPEWLEEPKMET